MSTETWRPVPTWEGHYSVSDLGQVRSETRVTTRGGRAATVNGRVLCAPLGGVGYRTVTLSAPDRRVVTTVGRLVLLAFVGLPDPGQECCHRNGDPTDDRLLNLRWDTHQANGADTVRHGTAPMLRRTHCPAGHPYDSTNTHHGPNGERTCLACRPARNARRRAARARLKESRP